MGSWVVTPTSLSLRGAFNKRFPKRAKGAEGTIGDTAHQGSPSAHNPDDTPGSLPENSDSDNIAEVRGLDIDSKLNDPKLNMLDVVHKIIARMKELGPKAPLSYIIYDRKYWGYENSWRQEYYQNSDNDPHTNHAHFSGRPGSGSGSSNPENYNGPWGFEEDVMTNEQLQTLIRELRALPTAVAEAVTAKLLSADVVPYTNAKGEKDTWRVDTALGYGTEGVRRERELLEAQNVKLDQLIGAVADLSAAIRTHLPPVK